MKLGDLGELKILERLRERFPPRSGDVVLGIGDDAAAVKVAGRLMLLSTDTMTEGVHFDPLLFTPYQIGFKLISSNVSDLFAMGGKPLWCLLNLTLPPDTETDFIDDFLEGLSAGLDRYGLDLVGGDITGSSASITTTLTVSGLAGERLVTRSGASPGDRLYLSGPLGEAACGFEILRRIGRPVRLERGETLGLSLAWNTVETLLRRFLLPEAHELSDHLGQITAMIDISDGLFLDLTRLCRESSVGALLYEERIPVTEALREGAAFLGIDPYSLITSGGEDYRQLFTSRAPLSRFTEIGEIREEGLSIMRNSGSEEEIISAGFQHFASR